MSTPKETIECELDRIAVELRKTASTERYTQLYAAQQALAWAKSPEGAMSPYEAVINGKVQPLISDTQEGSEDYSAAPRHFVS